MGDQPPSHGHSYTAEACQYRALAPYPQVCKDKYTGKDRVNHKNSHQIDQLSNLVACCTWLNDDDRCLGVCNVVASVRTIHLLFVYVSYLALMAVIYLSVSSCFRFTFLLLNNSSFLFFAAKAVASFALRDHTHQYTQAISLDSSTVIPNSEIAARIVKSLVFGEITVQSAVSMSTDGDSRKLANSIIGLVLVQSNAACPS